MKKLTTAVISLLAALAAFTTSGAAEIAGNGGDYI